MTPLAQRIVRELTLPKRQRTFDDRHGLLPRMSDLHCFDVTQVAPLIEQIRLDGFGRGHFDGRTAFAPAPKFWIECAAKSDGFRYAFHGESSDDDDLRGWFRFTLAGCSSKGAAASLGECFSIRLADFTARYSEERANETSNHIGWLYAALVIINSPRLIGRKQHTPHRGLERRLASANGLSGKFPLHAWTELTLRVSDIGKRADGTVHEDHYTGEKCLHFCRAHLRVRNGLLERVTAHWRGNPALGIKRTRYSVTA